jgi:membrane fusion protein, heavy metal efflux system
MNAVLRIIVVLALVNAACSKNENKVAADKAGEPEPHQESITNWTTKSELFVEYPPLIVGQTSRFAIHLTRLDTFKPISKARVEVRLAPTQGQPAVFTASAPSRPGIFGIDVKPSTTGDVHLTIQISGEITDVHDLGEIKSSATKAAAVHEHGPDKKEKIAFLKEQQWTLDFGTVIVEDRRLQSSLRVPAEILPRAGGEAEVTVPFDGRLVTQAIPPIGTRVSQGQVLGSLIPPVSAPGELATLELARSEANLSLQLAKRDRERAERLVSNGAAPAKRLDEARITEATAEARVKAAETRLAQYNTESTAAGDPRGVKPFALRAPIGGVVSEIHAAPRANVRAGEVLFKITDLDRVYISAVVPEADIPRVQQLAGAEIQVPGTARPRRLQRLVSIGRIVDTTSRTFPIIYELDNRDRIVSINQAVYVRLLTTGANIAPAVPESAVVDDGGRPIVFIQQAGETFLRRPVKLGLREAGYVQALEGVWPGERVVMRGAHLIRLSAMSNQVPAHGHVH